MYIIHIYMFIYIYIYIYIEKCVYFYCYVACIGIGYAPAVQPHNYIILSTSVVNHMKINSLIRNCTIIICLSFYEK